MISFSISELKIIIDKTKAINKPKIAVSAIYVGTCTYEVYLASDKEYFFASFYNRLEMYARLLMT